MKNNLVKYVSVLRKQIGVAAFFISWAFLAGFIMMNIVLAILVDSFTEAQAELKHEQARTPSANPDGMSNVKSLCYHKCTLC